MNSMFSAPSMANGRSCRCSVFKSNSLFTVRLEPELLHGLVVSYSKYLRPDRYQSTFCLQWRSSLQSARSSYWWKGLCPDHKCPCRREGIRRHRFCRPALPGNMQVDRLLWQRHNGLLQRATLQIVFDYFGRIISGNADQRRTWIIGIINHS